VLEWPRDPRERRAACCFIWSRGLRVPVEPDEVFLLEAGGRTGRDWELRLEPPVNSVVPIRPHPAGGTVGGKWRRGALICGIPVSGPPPA